MSDGNKAEKLASAKRKLRKFQKSRDKAQNKSTTSNTEKVPPTQKSVNHTEQNGSADGEVNLDEFPHHSETAAVTPPVDVNESLQKTAEAVLENATNCVESLPSNIIENVAELNRTESEPAQQNMAAHADVSDVAASDNFDTLRVDAETPESGESTLPPPPPADNSVSAGSLPNSNNNHQPADSAQTLASDNVMQSRREQEGLQSSVVQSHTSNGEMVNGDAKAPDELSTLKAPDQPTAINAGDALENDFSRTTYATETLLQISTKLNGLAHEAQAVTGGDCDVTAGEESAHMFVVSQLETRNRQLAEQTTLLNQQKQQLTLQVESVTQQMQALNVRLETEKQQIYAHGIQERNALQQQLQVQMQTIGVLVAEKQELQHQVHQSRTAATREQHLRQKCQDELRDTKSHLMAVERDLKSKTGEIDALQKSKKRAEEGRDEMESALKDVRNNVEENKMHSGELSQKLKLKENECTRLNSEVGDLNEKLAMAEVLLQQLSSTSGGGEAESQLQRLQEERESLNLKLVEYQQAFEQLTGEREQLSRQYEDVNHQMQSRVALLSNQVEVLEKEKSALLKSHEDLKSELAEVEKKKSQQLDQVESSAETAGVREEMETKIKQLDEEVDSLKKEKAEMSTQLQRQLNNNQQLARLNEEQEQQLAQMGHNITEHQVSFEEHSRLLDQSQSDKSALSRALMQNKKLKAQLEEMQHVFVKLSNDKMELATELSTLQHKERELSDEIRLLKSSRDEMEQQVQQKDEELELLREKEQTESHHQDHVLRDELMTSQENVLLLTEQNRELKSIVSKLHDDLDSRPPPRGDHLDSRPPPRGAEPTSSTADDEPLTPPGDERKVDDTSVDTKLPRIDDASVTSAPSSGDNPTSPTGGDEATPDYDTKISELNRVVQHLQSQLAETETQRNQLASHFQLQRDQHRELSDRLAEFQALDSRRRAESDSMVASEEHEALTRDMSLLQERFAKVMRERGDALVRIDDLEHINLQLQNECDTIGEYITLYHNQRKALQQKHNEKDRYISSMARERETMQKKFERLQSLVMTLLSRDDNNSRVTSSSVTSSSRSDDDVSTLLPPSHSDVSMNTSESMTSSPEQTTWPDMLEGEENLLATTKPDLLPHSATLRSHQPPPSPPPGGSKPPSPEEGTKDMTSFPGKLQKVGEESTASQIIELLEEMQHKPAMTSSARVTSSYDVPHGFCMRYMGRYTNL